MATPASPGFCNLSDFLARPSPGGARRARRNARRLVRFSDLHFTGCVGIEARVFKFKQSGFNSKIKWRPFQIITSILVAPFTLPVFITFRSWVTITIVSNLCPDLRRGCISWPRDECENQLAKRLHQLAIGCISCTWRAPSSMRIAKDMGGMAPKMS